MVIQQMNLAIINVIVGAIPDEASRSLQPPAIRMGIMSEEACPAITTPPKVCRNHVQLIQWF